VLLVELAKFAVNLGREFNLPSRAALEHHQSDALLIAGADAIQGALGLIQVLKVIQMFEDGLAHVESLGAAGAAGELLQALFNGWREANGKHRNLAIQAARCRQSRNLSEGSADGLDEIVDGRPRGSFPVGVKLFPDETRVVVPIHGL
jgi:hypothetical protein